MGIKGLSKFLKSKFPENLKTIHLSQYEEKKIAVDISSYLYKYKCTCGEREWATAFTRFLLRLRKINIHPIPVFDSQARPEKDEEIKSRKENKKNLREKTDLLEYDLTVARETGEVSEELQSFHEKRKLEAKRNLTENGKIIELNLNSIEFEIQKRRKQEVSITREDIEKVQGILEILGIQFIIAPHEAEAYCAELCAHGGVEAILTEDTDSLAYACPKVLYSLHLSELTCYEIEYSELLKSMNFTSEQFLDFCIMCGNDYNDNIAGIGPVKAFSLLSDCGCIEEIEQDTSVLNYQRGRELFRISSNEEIPIMIYCDVPMLDKVLEGFKQLQINVYPNELNKALYTKLVIEGGNDEESEEEDIGPEVSLLKDRTIRH